MLKLDTTKSITNDFISARPDTLQVYTFSGEGGSFDHLPMKQKRKGAKTVSKYPFQFFEQKKQKGILKAHIQNPHKRQSLEQNIQ